MSSNRYGQIWHGDHHHINIRFPSTEARLKFREEFEEYHNSHDHDGDIPIFKDVTTKDLKLGTGSRSPEDLMKAETDDTYRITIDGYHWSEIRSYQDNQDLSDYNWYRPPTCCVPPTIVIDSEYVSSADLKRHPLSAIFGNMPDSDFQSLLSSVESDGFIEPVIRIYEGQILDGWHRYRAAQELGIIRKLRFREWNEDSHRDGDPKVFVLARNIERRHLSAQQRAQVIVSFNERFEKGNVKAQRVEDSGSPNGEPKTRQELAKEAGVGTSTIDRAVQVEKAGQSEQVIAGEKSASQVITEETVKDLWAKVSEEIPKWKAREKEKCKYPSDSIGNASKSMLIEALRQCDIDNDNEGSATAEELKELLNRMQADDFPFVVAVRDVLKDRQKPVEKETAQPSQTAEEREANTELKQKKQVIKSIWDKRIEAARDYTGDADSDLNLNLTLPELEKGFAKYEDHKYCADAFQSAIRRTSETSFNICQEKTLASDVSLEALGAEYKALSTYALDILQWEKQEWIQQLIAAKKAKADKAVETPAEPEEDSPDRKAFNLALNNAQDRLAWMWDTFENMGYLTGVSRETFAVEAAKALNCYEEDQYSSGENYLLEKDYALLKNLTIPELKRWRKRFDDIQDAIHKKSDWVTALVPAEADNAPEPDMNALWEAFNKRLPKWKAKYAESGYQENDLIQASTEAELFEGLRSYRHSERIGEVTAEEIQDITDLMKRASYPYARHVRNLLRDKPKPEVEPDADDADTDLEKALESLMTTVDAFDACFLHDADFESDDYGKLCDLAAVEFECDRDMLYQIVHEEDCPEHFDEFELTKWEMIVRQMLEAVKSNADWVKSLRADDPSEVEKADTETTEVEVALYHDLNHLRVLQNTLSPLLESLGADDMSYHHKDILTADLYDVFLKYEQVPTEKEMVVALLDLAHSILFEEIPND